MNKCGNFCLLIFFAFYDINFVLSQNRIKSGDMKSKLALFSAELIKLFLGHGTLFSLKKSRGTPPAETVEKRNSVAYIHGIKLFSSKCR